MTYVDQLLTTPPNLAASTMVALDPGPLDGGPADAGLLDAGHPELAGLLSVLFLMMDDSRSLVINITSAHRGAGTSTVARRLAEAAAATGWCRVALLDARAGAVAAGQGLLDAIERGENPVLTPGRVGTQLIDTGRLNTAGRPLARVESIRKLYGTLRDRYALVVVDCPAIFFGQQTLAVAAAADDTVLVVEAERTALADVSRARAMLERQGAGVLGMVMNKSRPRIPALFGGNA